MPDSAPCPDLARDAAASAPSGWPDRSGLLLQGIGHAYATRGHAVQVLGGIDLHARAGEFVAVLGPSGCGKTTLFNIIAGLLTPARGEVFLDGALTSGETGHVAYMMQKDLLLKWQTILQNVTLGAEISGQKREAARARARALLPRFGLQGFEDCYPAALSGGMRQRAALLRTLLCDKPVILLDEPFAALDALTRAAMHEWLLDVWQEFRRTVVLITHDPEEAVFLADRIFVLTARPARIAGIIEVPFPRPRRPEHIGSLRFLELRQAILDLVKVAP